MASAKPEFTVWRMTDFMAYVPPKDDAILEIAKDQVIWREGETALLIGPGGVGKSRLALQLAVNQITGQPWVGLATCGHPRTWLFVGNENSCRRLKDELQSMLIGRALTADQFMAVQQHLLVQAPITPEDALIELDSDGGTPAAKATSGITANGRWKATLAKHRPDVLVVDPWEAVIAGSDANDSAATRQSVMELRHMLQEVNPRGTVLLVHHSREGATAIRQAVGFDSAAFIKGSKTLRSMARLQVNVAPGDEEDSRKIVLSSGKANNSARFATRGALLNLTTKMYELDESFELQDWIDAVERKTNSTGCNAADVWQIVRDGATKTGDIVKAMEQAFDASRSTVNRHLKAAIKRGYVAHGGKNGVYILGERVPAGR